MGDGGGGHRRREEKSLKEESISERRIIAGYKSQVTDRRLHHRLQVHMVLAIVMLQVK